MLTQVRETNTQVVAAPVGVERRVGTRHALGLTIAALLATMLVVSIQLSAPAPQPGFAKTYLSGDVGPSGAPPLRLARERLGWLPFGVSERVLPPTTYLWSLRAGWGVLVLVQILAIIACLRDPSPRLRRWAPAPVLATLLFLLYPAICNDVFSYSSFAWVANQGANPYVVRPMDLAGDPYAPFNYWVTITTPYGPLWTHFSRAAVVVTGGDPFRTALLFKATVAASALLMAWLTWATARRIPRTAPFAVAAFVAVAWSPVLMTEAAGSAHIDVVAALIAVAGLMIAVTPGGARTRLAIAIVACASLVKPTLVPLVGFVALMRVIEPVGWSTILRRWLGDIAVAAGLAVLAFLPYISSGLIGGLIDQQQRLMMRPSHSNPLWVWALPNLAWPAGGFDLVHHFKKPAASVSALLVMSVLLIWYLRRLFAARQIARTGIGDLVDTTGALLVSWAVFLCVLGYFPLNAHAWYVIPALPPLTLAWLNIDGQQRGWYLALTAWTGISFIAYHTLARG